MTYILKENRGILVGLILSVIIHAVFFYVLDRAEIFKKNILPDENPQKSKFIKVEIVTISENAIKNKPHFKENKSNNLTQVKPVPDKRKIRNIHEKKILTVNQQPDVAMKTPQNPDIPETKSPYDIKRKLNQIESRFFNPPGNKINYTYNNNKYSKNITLPLVPPDFLLNRKPVYPIIARENGYEGTVILLIKIDHQGRVVNTAIEKSSGYPILDRSALKASRKWRFNPARIENIGIDAKILVPVEFKLEE